MAAGAHISSAFSHDRPSFFEVIAQESLKATVRPAIRHLVRVAAETRPEKFGWLLSHFDNIYSTLDFILEHYCLSKHGATFAENFYNLKRICGDGNGKLNRSAFWKSLLCAVVVPYMKLKLDQWFEEARHYYSTHQSASDSSLVKACIAVYPYVHTAWEGTMLAYQTSYLLGKSDWHSPLLQLSGVTLVTNTESPEEHHYTGPAWKQLSLYGKILRGLRTMLGAVAVSLSSALSLGVFFIQFLDWWYASDTGSKPLTSLPVPDPPQRDDHYENSLYNVCPICKQTRSNDTVLTVSGYVYCYPCIYDFVRDYGICPVTRYPARTEHLSKLYLATV